MKKIMAVLGAGFRRPSPVTREALPERHELATIIRTAYESALRGKGDIDAADAVIESLSVSPPADDALPERLEAQATFVPETRMADVMREAAMALRATRRPSPVTREAVKQMLAENGFTPNGGHPHSWRCEHPDRYPGACRCVDEMTDDIMRLLSVSPPAETTKSELSIKERIERLAALEGLRSEVAEVRTEVEQLVSPPAEVEWEYAHTYYDEGGNRQRRKVTEGEFRAHAPDGFRSDGSPYRNYVQEKRVKAGPWVPVSPESEGKK